MGVSVPFLWIHDRVKFAPLAGFFWDDVADGKFRSSEFAHGAKILYYFPSKSEFIRESNHFYVGAVGMGRITCMVTAAKSGPGVDWLQVSNIF